MCSSGPGVPDARLVGVLYPTSLSVRDESTGEGDMKPLDLREEASSLLRRDDMES